MRMLLWKGSTCRTSRSGKRARLCVHRVRFIVRRFVRDREGGFNCTGQPTGTCLFSAPLLLHAFAFAFSFAFAPTATVVMGVPDHGYGTHIGRAFWCLCCVSGSGRFARVATGWRPTHPIFSQKFLYRVFFFSFVLIQR